MGRIRSIKPEFPQSETIGRLSRDARLLFVQLWTLADDTGKSRAASRMLASLLYPYDEDAPKLIDGWIAELEQNNCIRLYEVDGTHYLEIVNWLKHQRIDHPSPSRMPDFRESSRDLAKPSRILAPDLGPRIKDQDKERKKKDISINSDSETFEIWWQQYPRRVGKGAAKKAYARVLLSNLVTVDELITGARRYSKERSGEDPQFTKHPATWLNAACWADEPQEQFNGRGSVTQAAGRLQHEVITLSPRPTLVAHGAGPSALRLLPEGRGDGSGDLRDSDGSGTERIPG